MIKQIRYLLGGLLGMGAFFAYSFGYSLSQSDISIAEALQEKINYKIFVKEMSGDVEFIYKVEKVLDALSAKFAESNPQYSAIFSYVHETITQQIEAQGGDPVEPCVEEGGIEYQNTSDLQCCEGLSRFEYRSPGASSTPMCYDKSKGEPVCDYPERIRDGYQGPFYEAPYWIYPDGSGISSDPNVLGTIQCESK